MKSRAKTQIFITGGGGFIGSAVVGKFLANDVDAHVLVGAPDDSVREMPRQVFSAKAEITDYRALSEMAAGCDAVVHIAGPASVSASFDAPALYSAVHVDGTTTVLSVAREANIKRFIYVSSAEIYGRVAAQPVSEEQPLNPRSPYAAAKAGAEQMIRAYANTFGISARIVRPFSVYGPGQPPYALVPTIVRQALSDDAIVLSDLKPIRDYVYIDDVAEAIFLAYDADITGFSAFNIGSGTGTSVLELTRAVLTAIGRDLPILSGVPSTRPKDAEIYELVADTRRSSNVLHWAPRTSLAAGLQHVVAET